MRPSDKAVANIDVLASKKVMTPDSVHADLFLS